MSNKHVVCPHCRTSLRVPERLNVERVRCRCCREVFHLVSHRVSDEAVCSWLLGAGEDPAEQDEEVRTAVARSVRRAPPRRSEDDRVHVLRVDSDGVLFEFSASRLRKMSFRSAIPRRCLRCGARRHLQAHVVIFAPELTDSISLQEEHLAGELVVNDEELSSLDPFDLLQRLPRVPSAPAPADEPMPFYVCDMCGPNGLISGRIRPHEQADGTCQLWFAKPRRAEEFLIAADGPQTPELPKIQEEILRSRERPWDRLASVVQHRLEQWYRRVDGEAFVAYVADRSRSRTEDGMAGIVVTDRRMICHSQRRHFEAKPDEPIELHIALHGSSADLTIKTGRGRMKCCHIDGDGADRLRRALSRAKFQAHWR